MGATVTVVNEPESNEPQQNTPDESSIQLGRVLERQTQIEQTYQQTQAELQTIKQQNQSTQSTIESMLNEHRRLTEIMEKALTEENEENPDDHEETQEIIPQVEIQETIVEQPPQPKIHRVWEWLLK